MAMAMGKMMFGFSRKNEGLDKNEERDEIRREMKNEWDERR